MLPELVVCEGHLQLLSGLQADRLGGSLQNELKFKRPVRTPPYVGMR
jgi:hypothetical protein